MKIKQIIKASGVEPHKAMLNMAVKLALFEIFETESKPAYRHAIVKEISDLTGLKVRTIYYHFKSCRKIINQRNQIELCQQSNN
jgi:hypothetical protein